MTSPTTRTPLSALADITAALSASRDPERVLELVSESAVRLFSCSHTAIALLREDNHQVLELTRTHGLGVAFIEALIEKLKTDAGRLIAVSTPEPIITTHLAHSNLAPEYAALARAEGIKTVVELPLLTQGDVIGLVTLYFTTTRRFTKAENELFKTFASQAALAIANARLYAGIESALIRYSQQLQALKAINLELTSTLNLQHVLELVTERAMDYATAGASCIFVLEAGKDKFMVAAQRGYTTDILNLPEKRSATHRVASRVQESGRPLMVADLHSDPELNASREPYRSHLSVPIKNEGTVLGVVTLEDPRPGLFTDDHLSFITQLAAQTAIAITNANLFENVTESRDTMAAVLNSTREGVLVIDANGRIAIANHRLVELWGIEASNLLNRNLAELVNQPSLGLPAKLGATAAELLELLINLSQHLDIPSSRRTYQLDGPITRFIERTGTPVIDSHQRVIGWVMVLRDVTEEKEAQTAREQLTSMIVHDLRSPLTSVLGSLKLIDDVYRAKDDLGIMGETLDVGLRSTRRMILLVDSMLDVFRTESSKIPLNQGTHPIKTLVIALTDDLRPLAEEQSVALIVDIEDNLPDVNMDADKIERVLMNLLDNAIKFTPPDGKISVQLHRWDQNPAFVLCEVSDSGTGIPDNFLERIFDRYVQVSGNTGRRGVGLGLAFCRLAIEAHGGRIWAQNREGGGSAFFFTLPVAE
jgi:NtrC-family two-component system sensor histidine kinase KinB